MSGLSELALIRQAFAALPNGTPHERTLWIQQRKRELGSQTRPEQASTRTVQSGPKPFSQVADDPAVKRTGGDW